MASKVSKHLSSKLKKNKYCYMLSIPIAVFWLLMMYSNHIFADYITDILMSKWLCIKN